MPVKSYWSHWCARECFVVFGFEALEPETKAVALPVQDLHPVARLVEENKKKHRVEHRHFGVGTHREGLALERNPGAQLHKLDGGFECGDSGALTQK